MAPRRAAARLPVAGPDRDAALALYRRRASVYDLELTAFEPLRRRAVEWLDLRPGQTVLDVGCGTGLSLPLLAPALGPKGRVVGIEQCPEMIALARERVADAGWGNVTLIEAPVETAQLRRAADGALLHFVHDVLQEPAAVDNVLAHLKPGARVVVAGLKWAPPWALPSNLFVLGAALRSVSSLAGLDAPWALLARRLQRFEIRTMALGSLYVARGVVGPQ